MKKLSLLVLMLCTTLMFSQTPTTNNTVKKTPASDALVQAAKDVISGQAAYDAGLKAAKTELEPKNKELTDKINAANEKLLKALKADPKYKPMLAEIDALQKQATKVQQDAQTAFDQKFGVIHNKLAVDQTLVGTLVPIVRKENGFAETVVFDVATQTWK